MNKYLKISMKILIWVAAIIAGFYLFLILYLSLRYSPEYMIREYFSKQGGAYDYREQPFRELHASQIPFSFEFDLSREGEVQDAFQKHELVGSNLDEFLEGTGTQAFLVIQGNTVIYERYFLGFSRETLATSFSVAKAFDSALVGIAIEEGYIESVDDPITDNLPELADRDPRFANIHIKHLLMNASGLKYVKEAPFGWSDGALTYGFNDLRHLALTETRVGGEPGITFDYNNYNPILLGMILERATGKSVSTYLQEKIWDRIGMEYDGSWSLDSEKSGFEKMESGLNARPIDFAKFGRLFLLNGEWDGVQVVPEEWVQLSTSDNGLIQGRSLNYGYLWWGKDCSEGSHDFFAMGNYGQFIYVSPEKDLVIVRNGESYGLEGEFETWADILSKFSQNLP